MIEGEPEETFPPFSRLMSKQPPRVKPCTYIILHSKGQTFKQKAKWAQVDFKQFILKVQYRKPFFNSASLCTGPPTCKGYKVAVELQCHSVLVMYSETHRLINSLGEREAHTKSTVCSLYLTAGI